MMDYIMKNSDFAKMMKEHIKELIGFFTSNDVAFSLVANLEFVKFNPALPQHITESLQDQPAILFELDGYTLSSIKLDDEDFTFHAGFGDEMFASFVTIPYGAVIQILVSKNPLLTNFALYKSKDDKMARSRKAFKL
ncbi:hypothetical protein [uncultured Campylobacter sp.]|uniref:hypothetical protein n=1 Tax=uncultured Campylobacter sp. TaxID=218934 RepID=UPI00260262AA|nr:hypothetical protein [uncultured Campylobacter sp.]